MNDKLNPVASTLVLDHPTLVLKDYVHNKLANAASRLEEKLAKEDPFRHGAIAWAAWEAEGEQAYLEKRRHLEEQRAIDLLHGVFHFHLEVYLDNRFEYHEIRTLLLWLYIELLERTFVLKWPANPAVDRHTSFTQFAAVAEERLSNSPEWSQFMRQLAGLAERAGHPEDVSQLSFRELVVNGRLG